MLKRYAFYIFFITLGFYAGLVIFPVSGFCSENDKALEFYHKAIEAKTLGERENYFEKSLELYLVKYNEMKQKTIMNGLLCYNIGNCFFNLKQIGQAVYYYRTGLKLLPGNEKLKDNLAIALEKRENPVDFEISGLKYSLLFFHYNISNSDKINMIVIISIISSILIFTSFYYKKTFIKYFTIISCFSLFCLFSSLGVKYYSPNHIGIVIKETEIRKAAGSGFAPIIKNPLGEGSSIRVLSLNKDWYLVKLNDGRKGYIEKDHLKIII